jgi:glycosyltransferase involved in cell wall biosynthesis
MKIAQIAPLAESVPPRLYGGTERVVSYLTDELVRLGHEVTLFASADSVTRARLLPCAPRALRLDPEVHDPLPHHLLMLERVRQRAREFDLLHFHIEPPLHFPVFRELAGKTLTTLHGRLDLPDLRPLFGEFADMPLVSISDNQRRPLPAANWVGTVHHGLPAGVCPFNPAPRGDYFAFLGRVSPEKGLERAIAIACATGVRLRIAAKVDAADREYFRKSIVPALGGPVEYLGELGEGEKAEFLGNAAALLFPVDWPEPFGLAMIEAMACGTPVLAWRRGAVPEIVEHGVSGFIVDALEQAVALAPRLVRLDRARVRVHYEAHFTAARMARDYLAVYRALGRRHALAAV